jgi:hypothetical protein
MDTINFALVVDRLPYTVNAVPFNFNDELRFRVTYNDSPEFIFALDPEVNQLVAIDHDAVSIPDTVETAISEKLLNRSVKNFQKMQGGR